MRYRSFLIATLAAFLFGHVALPLQPALAETTAKTSRDFATSAKKKTKKSKTKKSTAAPATAAAATARLNSDPVDPMASEPSEVIMAIKNRAERAYWEGRKTPAQRQAEFDKGVSLSSGTLQRAGYSEISGVTFDDQPLRMAESEAFRRSLDSVAAELGLSCKTREYLGWPLAQTEQARVDRIFNDSMARLKTRGFSVTPRQPRAVGSDVSVFTAVRRAVPVSKQMIGMWSAGDVGLLMLACETEPAKAAPAKSKSGAKKAKTSSAKKKTGGARPKVIPGAPRAADAPAASPAVAPAASDSGINAPAAAFNPSETRPAEAPAEKPVEKPAEKPADAASPQPAPAPAAAEPVATEPKAEPKADAAPASSLPPVTPSPVMPPAVTPPVDAPVADAAKDAAAAATDAAKDAVKDAVKDAAGDAAKAAGDAAPTVPLPPKAP